MLPITDFQHGSAADTVVEPTEPGAWELSQGVPQHLEPLPTHVEEDGAVRLPRLTEVVRDGGGGESGPTHQSASVAKMIVNPAVST